MTQRVLVTGARGFIGSHCLTPLLARGYEVHAVSREIAAEASSPSHERTPHPVTPGTPHPPAPSPAHGRGGERDLREQVVWHRADLLDAEQAAGLVAAVRPTHLLHLAWEVTPGAFWTSPRNRPWVDASLGLLAAFGANGGRRAVLAGTCAEYGLSDEPCREGVTPLAPTTVYGASKAALGVMLPAFAAQYGVESAAWARLFYPFGPGEPAARLVPAAIRALSAGVELACTHGQQVRDVLYVADVADALAALLDTDVPGAVNVGSGRGVTLRVLLSLVGAQLGGERLLRFGARPAPPDDPPFLVADTTRLAREVGWTPVTSLEDGIRQSVAWWRVRDDHGQLRGCGHRSPPRNAPREGWSDA